jgi:hypothetical protein
MAIYMRYVVNDGLHGLKPINKHTGGRKESMEKTLKSITKEEFDALYIIRNIGPNTWQAFNKITNQPASPGYNCKDAAINYVQQDLKQEMNIQIDKMLGGNGDITSIYDDTSLHSRLPDAITRNGTEEK